MQACRRFGERTQYLLDDVRTMVGKSLSDVYGTVHTVVWEDGRRLRLLPDVDAKKTLRSCAG